MPERNEPSWISICLLNLCVVAFFGFVLRSKILFSLPFVSYPNVLQAHSHVAFTGWAGLTLLTLFIYRLLPPYVAKKRFYPWMLIATQVCTIGMALTFPVWGYTAPSIIFSSLYIVVSFLFTPVFIKDLQRHQVDKTVRLLSSAALASLVLSAAGPALLVYIMVSKSGNTVLYRDSVYTFLHFQYNGFFTLAVFALLLNHAVKRGVVLTRPARLFAFFSVLSVVPALALSLLWHNSAMLYLLAGLACLLMLLSVYFLLRWLRTVTKSTLFTQPLARTLWRLAFFSFALKTVLNIGTLYPPLGNAVYGDRPVIIGFLHLVFLGFLTFYFLAVFVEHGYFKKLGKTVVYPFVVFGTGIIANEVFLMLQGLGHLFKVTTASFNWLLWGGSILLFAGAILLAVERLRIGRRQQSFIE